jgi:hypothetical protein
MRSGNMENDFISIRVSSEAMTQTFATSKRLLKDLSGYFESALCGRWEGNNIGRRVKPEDDPRIFELFLQYAHSGRLQAQIPSLANMYGAPDARPKWPIKLLNEHEEEAMDEAEDGDEDSTTQHADTQLSFSTIVDIYTFSDRRHIPRLSALAITLLVPKIYYTDFLPVSALACLLHETALGKETSMFQHLVAIAAPYVSDKEFEDYNDELPAQFLVAVLKARKGSSRATVKGTRGEGTQQQRLLAPCWMEWRK